MFVVETLETYEKAERCPNSLFLSPEEVTVNILILILLNLITFKQFFFKMRESCIFSEGF